MRGSSILFCLDHDNSFSRGGYLLGRNQFHIELAPGPFTKATSFQRALRLGSNCIDMDDSGTALVV